jgi:hypothetical protein
VLGHDRWSLAGVPGQPPWHEQLESMIDSVAAPASS